MKDYLVKYEPEYLERLETLSARSIAKIQWREKHRPRGKASDDDLLDDFQCMFIYFLLFHNIIKCYFTFEYFTCKTFSGSKDITESFIQIRLQNDWLFRDRKWAWR